MTSELGASASEDLGADCAKARAQGWLPRREFARQTGVKAVTRRAWERRYGLIVPNRTPKGHRLFNAEHVQRILSILTWIDRGVAVSKIKPLLDSPLPPSEPLENDWQRQRHALLRPQIGRASCRKGVCQKVENSVVGVCLKKKNQ